MSSAFQSSQVAEFNPTQPPPQQQMQQPQAQIQQQNQVQNHDNKQNVPLIYNDLSQVIAMLNNWNENEQDIQKIWSFISSYITVLENSQEVSFIMEKISGEKRFVEALKKIKGKQFKNTIDFISTIQSLPNKKLNENENAIFQVIKLNLKEGAVLEILIKVISSLPKKSKQMLDQKIMKELNYTTDENVTKQSNNSGSGSDFLNKEITIPGCSTGISCKYVILIVALVLIFILIGLYMFYYSSKKSTQIIGGEPKAELFDDASLSSAAESVFSD